MAAVGLGGGETHHLSFAEHVACMTCVAHVVQHGELRHSLGAAFAKGKGGERL